MSTAPQPNVALADFRAAGEFTNDPLLSDGHNVVTKKGTMPAAAGFIKRGTVLFIDPATGVIDLNGPEYNAVLAENVDATTATQQAIVYVSGRMKADAIIWPIAGSRSDIANKLRDFGILIETVILREGYSTSAVVAVTLNPTSAAPTNAGGAASFTVALSEAGTWSATKDAGAAWLSITAPTQPQGVNGAVNYTVAPNGAGQAQRAANIYVNGQTFTVTQAAGA